MLKHIEIHRHFHSEVVLKHEDPLTIKATVVFSWLVYVRPYESW